MSAPKPQFTGPQPSATAIFYRNIGWLRFVDRFGRKGQAAMEYLGGMAELAWQTMVAAVTRPFYSGEVLSQMDEIGVKSLSITGITALFTGMVLALQTAYSLAAFGGKPDFSALSFTINKSHFLYGAFINALISFVVIAAAVFFLVVKPVNALMSRRKTETPVDELTRPCPECLSEIPVAASRCAFCTQEVAGGTVTA